MHKIAIFILLIMFWIDCPAQDMEICNCNGFEISRDTIILQGIKEEKPCHMSEKAPKFPGGYAKLNKFFRLNSSYQILQNSNLNIETDYVRVNVCLMIDKSGAIIDKKIRTINDDFRSDALKVISLMPTWIPAKQSNRPVIGRYIFELKYKNK